MSVRVPSVRPTHVAGARGVRAHPVRLPAVKAPVDIVDEYGLGPWAKDLVPKIKSYISRVYRFFRIDPSLNPTGFFGHGAGTIPELVVFGFLLEQGFQYNSTGPRGFRFQADEAGGRRIPGGAVVDIEVFIGTRRIGVRVNSIYHSPDDPFGGGKAVWANEEQRIRLMGTHRFDVVMDVSQNRELEIGPSEAIDRDLFRILQA